MSILQPSVGSKEIILLFRSISIMLRAGVSLLRILSVLEADAPKRTRRIITHLRNGVETGRPLAEALETSPRRFPPLAVNLVRAGEQSGSLVESLTAIVKHLRASEELKHKIRNAMMYPLFVLIAITGLGLSVGILVLPKLIPLFESFDVELPWTTRVILWIAKFFEVHGVLAGITAVVCGFFGFIVYSSERTKPFVQQFFSSLPYIRKLSINAGVAEFAGTLGTLLRNGITLPVALEATAKAMRNRAFRKKIFEIIPSVNAGATFSSSLRKTGKFFPSMALTLITVGEESGTLAQTLEYIAISYEEEVDTSLKNLTTALEPMLLIGIGIIVGFTVLAIITPIYDITGGVV